MKIFWQQYEVFSTQEEENWEMFFKCRSRRAKLPVGWKKIMEILVNLCIFVLYANTIKRFDVCLTCAQAFKTTSTLADTNVFRSVERLLIWYNFTGDAKNGTKSLSWALEFKKSSSSSLDGQKRVESLHFEVIFPFFLQLIVFF